MDHQQLTQTATEVDDHGNILRQAGIQLDANGQIFYATDNERNLGSYLRNTAESLTALYTSGESMRSQLVMTAESLTTVFNKTGIDSLGASETLYSRQVMTAESLTTVFQKTGIDSLGVGETLYSQQMHTAESLTTVFEKTGIDSLSNGETLYSRQIQTAESMTTLYTKTGVGSLGANETLYSFVVQTAESINQEVGNVESGLYSRISQTESQISLKVSNGDVATQLSVEMDNVSISNGNLVVDGYVTAAQLNAQKARFDNLESPNGGIVGIYSGSVNASDTITGPTLYASSSLSIGTGTNGGSGTLYYRGTQYYRQAIKMGGVAGSIALGYFLGDSTTALNLDHYHSISASEGTGANAGRILITLGAPQASEGSANFNIAATQFYQDGVAAARDEGKAAVTLNDPTWNAISGDLTSSRTVTVSTDGRTPSLSKSVPLFLTVSGQTVYLRADSSSGTAYAKATVTAPDQTVYYWENNTRYSFPSGGKRLSGGVDIMVGTSESNRYWVLYPTATTLSSAWSGSGDTKTYTLTGDNVNSKSMSLTYTESVWSNGSKTITVTSSDKPNDNRVFQHTVTAPTQTVYYWENNTRYSFPSGGKRLANGVDIMVGTSESNRHWVLYPTVNVSRSAWSGGHATFSPSSGTGSSYDLYLGYQIKDNVYPYGKLINICQVDGQYKTDTGYNIALWCEPVLNSSNNTTEEMKITLDGTTALKVRVLMTDTSIVNTAAKTYNARGWAKIYFTDSNGQNYEMAKKYISFSQTFS